MPLDERPGGKKLEDRERYIYLKYGGWTPTTPTMQSKAALQQHQGYLVLPSHIGSTELQPLAKPKLNRTEPKHPQYHFSVRMLRPPCITSHWRLIPILALEIIQQRRLKTNLVTARLWR